MTKHTEEQTRDMYHFPASCLQLGSALNVSSQVTSDKRNLKPTATFSPTSGANTPLPLVSPQQPLAIKAVLGDLHSTLTASNYSNCHRTLTTYTDVSLKTPASRSASLLKGTLCFFCALVWALVGSALHGHSKSPPKAALARAVA